MVSNLAWKRHFSSMELTTVSGKQPTFLINCLSTSGADDSETKNPSGKLVTYLAHFQDSCESRVRGHRSRMERARIQRRCPVIYLSINGRVKSLRMELLASMRRWVYHSLL